MGDHPEERVSKGCAAFVNLIFSLLVLLVLLVVLLPNTIQMPDWFESFRNITLVEKRKAWGAVHTFTYFPADPVEHLLIFNTRSKTSSLKDALNKENQPKKELQAQLTLKQAGENNILWDKKLNFLDADQVPRSVLLSQKEIVYTISKDRVWALEKASGEELWQTTLPAPLLGQQLQNAAINAGQALMILLIEGPELIALDLSSGRQKWQKKISEDISPQFFLA
ncbi:MAG: PQQ-binding-like beta-propeller repeat protein, partial [Bacteroidota bacterium]